MSPVGIQKVITLYLAGKLTSWMRARTGKCSSFEGLTVYRGAKASGGSLKTDSRLDARFLHFNCLIATTDQGEVVT